MKAKYYGARPSRNDYKGGQRLSLDEYNRSFKGDAFNTEYKKKHYPDSMGYMSRGIKEYNRYPETKDTTKDNDDKKNGVAAAAVGSMFKKGGGRSRQRLFQQALVLVVGSIMIATSYQAMASRQDNIETEEPTVSVATDGSGDNSGDLGLVDSENETVSEETTAPETEETTSSEDSQSDDSSNNSQYNNGSDSTALSDNGTSDDNSDNSDNSDNDGSDSDKSVSVSWDWSDDHKSATLIVKDSSGDVTDKVKADVTKSEQKATCNKAGKITYTAKATSDGKTYTDKESEKLSALGHKFDKGKEVTLDDGSSAMQFKCKRCGKNFTIKNSLDEE